VGCNVTHDYVIGKDSKCLNAENHFRYPDTASNIFKNWLIFIL